MQTTISQNSQSRDASLTSHHTNDQATVVHPGRSSRSKQQLITAVLFPASGKQNLVTKTRVAGPSAKASQIVLKGTKQALSRNVNQNTSLMSAVGNSRNTMQNQNNSVFAVSIKGSNANQTISGLQHASPNQSFVQQPQRNGKKPNLVGASIPTKLIKPRGIVRGAPQVPSKQILNVLKRQTPVES